MFFNNLPSLMREQGKQGHQDVVRGVLAFLEEQAKAKDDPAWAGIAAAILERQMKSEGSAK